MTIKRLRYTVLCVIVFLLIYASLGALAKVYTQNMWYQYYKDSISIALAIPAAFLAAAFARRNSYLQGLRDYWRQLLPSIQTAIQYTHYDKPNQEQFATAQVAISMAIDLTRAVFKNVPHQGAPSGLYPFENLKDIQKVLSWLAPGESSRSYKERDMARNCIVRLWQEMYGALLREFDRDTPIDPVSKYLHNGRSIADNLIRGKLRDECQECRRVSQCCSTDATTGRP
jgi:hypothetical protein